MSLLEKFAKVEIKADERISAEDKKFCKAHQSAYDDARSSLQELQFYWETMLESQKQLLSSIGENNHSMYLSDHSNLTISVRDIEKQIKKTHFAFIHSIVRHFEEIYHIVLDEGDIETALLPKQPGDRWRNGYEEEMIQYNEQMLNLTLDYQQIIEQIFNQTDGRDLWEQAEFYLKQQCHNAAWRFNKPSYERKTHTVQFSSAVNYDRTLPDSSKTFLKGLAHFETGKIGIYPGELGRIINTYRLYEDSFEFEDCTKIKKMRIFRNGRMDIRFTEEAHAIKFIEVYLRTRP